MPALGDIAVARFGDDNRWHYDVLTPGTSSVLSFGTSGATQVTGMGTSDGQLPRCKLPLSVMDMNLAAPLTLTGNVISIAGAATALAMVATSGSYNDLSSRPTLGTAAAQNASAFATAAQGALAASALQPGASIPWSTLTSVPATISGFGIIDGVSTSGSYANPGWITSFAYSKLTGAPSLATVATTGAYSDLTGKPTIPSAQVNSDWNSSTGLSQILNKPTLGTAAAQNTSAFDSAGAASSAQAFSIQRANQTGTQAWGTITGTPTTIAGYGITDDTSNARAAISLTTTGTSGAAAYSSSTGVLNVPNYTYTAPARVFSTPTFSGITTAAQLSTTRDGEVCYDIDATVTISLLAGQSVTAILTYADNSAMSTNPVVVSSQVVSNSGVLGLTQINTLKVSGYIPANKFRKVTFAVTNSATAPTTLKAGQEVLV